MIEMFFWVYINLQTFYSYLKNIIYKINYDYYFA